MGARELGAVQHTRGELMNTEDLENETIVVDENVFVFRRPKGMRQSKWEALCEALELYAEEF